MPRASLPSVRVNLKRFSWLRVPLSPTIGEEYRAETYDDAGCFQARCPVTRRGMAG